MDRYYVDLKHRLKWLLSNFVTKQPQKTAGLVPQSDGEGDITIALIRKICLLKKLFMLRKIRAIKI